MFFKLVMSGSHRGMGGEHGAAPADLGGALKIDTIFFHDMTDAFQPGKGAVPFIHVTDRRKQIHGLESPAAADSQKRFLGHPDFAVAGVQPGGDVLNMFRIFRQVGIQQQKPDLSHLNFPDTRMNHPMRSLNLDHQIFAGCLGDFSNRQIKHIDDGIGFLLPSVMVQILTEIAFPVQQSDAGQGKAQSGRGLEVIAGQHPESAGKKRQGFMQAEFHGKVRQGFTGFQDQVRDP